MQIERGQCPFLFSCISLCLDPECNTVSHLLNSHNERKNIFLELFCQVFFVHIGAFEPYQLSHTVFTSKRHYHTHWHLQLVDKENRMEICNGVCKVTLITLDRDICGHQLAVFPCFCGYFQSFRTVTLNKKPKKFSTLAQHYQLCHQHVGLK